jgi:cytochrome c oxidase cbb3-type subunit 3
MCSASDLRRSLALALACTALAISACDRHPSEGTAMGAPPPVPRPLGPIPGPSADAGVTTNPYPAQDPIVLNEGRLYFGRYNCAGCHGDHGGGGMGPSLRDQDWIYGGGDADIFASIAEGRAHGMPAWGVKLPQEVVWKLVAYIQSLRKEYEPQPPDQTIPPPPMQ